MMRLFLMIGVLSVASQGCKSSGSPSVKVSEVPSQPVQGPIVEATPKVITPAPIIPKQTNEDEIWKARAERDRAETELAKAKENARILAAQRTEEDRVRAERERLENLGTSEPPVIIPPEKDLTVTYTYRYGRRYHDGNGSFTIESKAKTYTPALFTLTVERGLTCDLKKIDEQIFTCDYLAKDLNCSESCWYPGQGKTCTMCERPISD